MKNIEKNSPISANELESFLIEINCKLPLGFIDFYKESNGVYINFDNCNIEIWPLNDLIELNVEYGIEEFAPDFFIFGSDGGNTAFVFDKMSGYIFEMPFIGMSKEEAIFIANSFFDFLKIKINGIT